MWRAIGQPSDEYATSEGQINVIAEGESVIHAHADRTGLTYGGLGEPNRPVYRIVDVWDEEPERSLQLFVLHEGLLWPMNEWRSRVKGE